MFCFSQFIPIGEWLRNNRRKMKELALMINASASRKMYIIFPNLGPACYNATVLRNRVNINKSNIVVATSDIGLETLPIVAEIAQIPMRNIFCPPVWGFVGINQLVDIRTTVHKYNSFEPYSRYTKVKNSTLHIGSITPEMRTLDYLMHFDTSLWTKVTEMKASTEINYFFSACIVPLHDIFFIFFCSTGNSFFKEDILRIIFEWFCHDMTFVSIIILLALCICSI